MNIIAESIRQFLSFTGFANMSWQHLIMSAMGILCKVLAVWKD